MPENPRWLKRCYDDSLVTQIAGTIVPADIRGEILRAPTSSSTMPGLVVRMLDDLHVTDGHKVLEIGTGTGYSTGLLCHRLDDDQVTSVEVDADVASAARIALGRAGFHPHLVTGDGLNGHPDGALYDRTIATCGLTSVPYAWVEQTRPGGLILATVSGWLYSSELARLTVGDDGSARGSLLGGGISFMLARPQLPPPLGTLPDMDAGDELPAVLGAGVLEDWTTRFVAQIAAPGAQRFTLQHNGGTDHVLLDVGSGAWAALTQKEGAWTVRQGGTERLWDAVEEQVAAWRSDGAPGLEHFEVTVSPEGQTITWTT
nr:ATP-grasp peptide maturase system methyltransferase [Streptomyces typhae]